MDAVKSIDCTYLVAGQEVGAEGTPHLQGYVCFASAKTLSAVKRLGGLGRAHLEQQRGTPEQAAVYCKKDGVVFEKGTLPLTPAQKGEKEQERWTEALLAVEEGRLADVPADMVCRHLKSMEYAVNRVKLSKRRLATITDEEMPHEWLYGPPGSGKSRQARERHPGAYIKDPTSQWWDGYKGEDVVIIDDFDKYQVKQGGDMKRWLDRYAFQAQIKGGQTLIRPSKVVVTSNYHPDQIWEDKITQEAIMRRLKVIHVKEPRKRVNLYNGDEEDEELP